MRTNCSILATAALLVLGSVGALAQPRAIGPVAPFRTPGTPVTRNAQVLTPTFTFGTIDYPDGPQTVAEAINKKGEIVGSWGPDINDYRQGLPAYGFKLTGSSFKKIVYPSAPITVPFGVNYYGEVVGYYSLDPQDLSGHRFTLVGTTFTTVDYPGAAGTGATGINNAGQIVGTYFNTPYVDQGFTDFSGVFSTVDYPGADISGLTGINDEGQVVGVWGGPSAVNDYDIHGFVETPIPGTFGAQRGNGLKGKLLAPRN